MKTKFVRSLVAAAMAAGMTVGVVAISQAPASAKDTSWGYSSPR